MKSVKYIGWTLFALVIIMMTITLTIAAPHRDTLKRVDQRKTQDLNFQDELNRNIYCPIHVTSKYKNGTVRIKTVRRTWSSINGSDYKALPVGNNINLIKQTK